MTNYIISEECLEGLRVIYHIASETCEEIRANTLLEHDDKIRQNECKEIMDILFPKLTELESIIRQREFNHLPNCSTTRNKKLLESDIK